MTFVLNHILSQTPCRLHTCRINSRHAILRLMANLPPTTDQNQSQKNEDIQKTSVKPENPPLSEDKIKEFTTPELITLEQPHLFGNNKKLQPTQPSARKSFLVALFTVAVTICFGIAAANFFRHSLTGEKPENFSLQSEPLVVPTAIPTSTDSSPATRSGFDFQQTFVSASESPVASPTTESAFNQTGQIGD